MPQLKRSRGAGRARAAGGGGRRAVPGGGGEEGLRGAGAGASARSPGSPPQSLTRSGCVRRACVWNSGSIAGSERESGS